MAEFGRYDVVQALCSRLQLCFHGGDARVGYARRVVVLPCGVVGAIRAADASDTSAPISKNRPLTRDATGWTPEEK